MTTLIDKTSIAYARGFEQAFTGRDFRNPCAGNETASLNHYAGFLAGESARSHGCASFAEYEAREASLLAEALQ